MNKIYFKKKQHHHHENNHAHINTHNNNNNSLKKNHHLKPILKSNHNNNHKKTLSDYNFNDSIDQAKFLNKQKEMMMRHHSLPNNNNNNNHKSGDNNRAALTAISPSKFRQSRDQLDDFWNFIDKCNVEESNKENIQTSLWSPIKPMKLEELGMSSKSVQGPSIMKKKVIVNQNNNCQKLIIKEENEEVDEGMNKNNNITLKDSGFWGSPIAKMENNDSLFDWQSPTCDKNNHQQLDDKKNDTETEDDEHNKSSSLNNSLYLRQKNYNLKKKSIDIGDDIDTVNQTYNNEQQSQKKLLENENKNPFFSDDSDNENNMTNQSIIEPFDTSYDDRMKNIKKNNNDISSLFDDHDNDDNNDNDKENNLNNITNTSICNINQNSSRSSIHRKSIASFQDIMSNTDTLIHNQSNRNMRKKSLIGFHNNYNKENMKNQKNSKKRVAFKMNNKKNNNINVLQTKSKNSNNNNNILQPKSNNLAPRIMKKTNGKNLNNSSRESFNKNDCTLKKHLSAYDERNKMFKDISAIHPSNVDNNTIEESFTTTTRSVGETNNNNNPLNMSTNSSSTLNSSVSLDSFRLKLENTWFDEHTSKIQNHQCDLFGDKQNMSFADLDITGALQGQSAQYSSNIDF